jgi:hypothetical protein
MTTPDIGPAGGGQSMGSYNEMLDQAIARNYREPSSPEIER